MRKMSLIEMVQNIASAMDGDEVNSITDTTESLQICEVIKETFYEQFNNILVPELRGLVQLMDVSDSTKPNYLLVPDNISKLEWIKYKDFRNKNHFTEVEYLAPEAFLVNQLQYNATASTLVSVVDPSGLTYFVKNNQRPTYFTLFDDKYIAFNAVDKTSEAVLQSSNTMAFGWKSVQFLMQDSFVPPIDGNLFPLLLAEAKATCFINLKQISSSKEEQRAHRQRIRMQNDQFRARKAQADYRNSGPNYSRTRG